jgi:hypothetical protein
VQGSSSTACSQPLPALNNPGTAASCCFRSCIAAAIGVLGAGAVLVLLMLLVYMTLSKQQNSSAQTKLTCTQ